MTVLEETGHADDTLVIFLSDNGPPFPGAKTNHYEPGSRLPLIVRKPGLRQAGVTTQARVTWADLTATVLDWCNVQPGPGVPLRPAENTGERKTAGKAPYRNHGKSFLKVLDDPGTDAFNEIFLSHTFHEVQMYYPMRTVISGRYKYIYNVAHQLPYPFASDLYASPTWQGVLARENDQQMYGQRTVQQYVFRAARAVRPGFRSRRDPQPGRGAGTGRAIERTAGEAAAVAETDGGSVGDEVGV